MDGNAAAVWDPALTKAEAAPDDVTARKGSRGSCLWDVWGNRDHSERGDLGLLLWTFFLEGARS